MADQFGALALPVDATATVVGDPALTKLGSFLQAVLNAECAAAWLAVQPAPIDAPPTVQVPVVQTVYLHDLRRFAFNENALPALFVWRERGKQEQFADDWRSDVTTFRVTWVMPALAQEEQRARQPITQAIIKAIGTYIEEGRHAAWVDAGDTEPSAATYAADPGGFVTAHATTTTPHTFSGAGLNGDLGGAVLTSRRVPMVVTAIAPSGTYNVTTPIVWTVVDAFGNTALDSIQPTVSSGGETLYGSQDYSQVSSIYDPGQQTTAGSLQFGAKARAGYGSSLRVRAGFDIMLTEDWETVLLEHVVLDGDQSATVRLPHHGIQCAINVRESFEPDLTPLAPSKNQLTLTESGLVVDQATLT
jgi:hypothetical protein